MFMRVIREFPGQLILPVVFALSACMHHVGAEASGTNQRPTTHRSLATAPDRFFSVGEHRFRYRDIGRGDAIVMLHGRGGRLESWNWLADSLALNYRVIAIDQRGHGQSTKPTHPGSYGRAMASDVIALLDHLRITRANLVGFSLGAVVTANVAAAYRNRVTTVTLIAGPFYDDSATTAQATAAYVAEMKFDPQATGRARGGDAADSAFVARRARILANSSARHWSQ